MDIEPVIQVRLQAMERFKQSVHSQMQGESDGPINQAFYLWAIRYRSYIQRRYLKYSRGGGDWPPLAPSTLARRRRGMPDSASGVKAKPKAKASSGTRTTRKTRSVSLQRRASKALRGVFRSLKRASAKKVKSLTKKFTNKKSVGKSKTKPGTVAILRDTSSMFNSLAPSIEPPAGSINQRIPFGILVGFGGPAKHNKDAFTTAELAYWHQIGAGRLPVRKTIVPPDDVTVKGMVKDLERALKNGNNI